jgi:hypothetical protein
LTGILLDSAVKTADGVVFVAEFLFIAYPLVRKYLKNSEVFQRLLFSNVLSTAIMISVLWLAYVFSKSIVPLAATTSLLVVAGLGGTIFFFHDFLGKRRPLSREEWGILLMIFFAVSLAVVSGLSQPFTDQGDPYAYYVPIGRYLNLYPGAYAGSFYRFYLSRNFAYYALFAHADLLGGTFGSYRLLPVPFLLGTIFGIVSVSKKLTRQNTAALLATACYVFSVYFGLILKYNMFYLGNLFMGTMAMFYCLVLISVPTSRLEKVALPFSTFAMVLLYDFSFILLVPLAFGYLSVRKPRLTLYLTAALAAALLLVVSQASLTIDLAQFQKLDFQCSLVFAGLLLIVVAGVRGKTRNYLGPPPASYAGMIATYIAAGASLLFEGIVNLVNYGFFTSASYALSGPVLEYMQRAGLFYQTTPNIANTLASIFFSDVFFGWGLFFTAYGIFKNRGSPMSVFFLTVLPIMVLVETINSNYLRFAIFLAPVIIVFLASSLHALVQKNSVLLGVSLLLVALLDKAITVFPDLDYENMAIITPLNVVLFGATISLVAVFYNLRSNPRCRIAASRFLTRVRRFAATVRSRSARIVFLRSMGWRQAVSLLMIALCIPVLSYNVLAAQHSAEIYPSEAQLVDQKVLPLIPAGSSVVTVELVHADFNFYKDVIVIPMAYPLVLESFLRLQLANVSALVNWLSSNRIAYVFVDRNLTLGNSAVFGLFDQLTTSCTSYSQCTPLYSDGRFVLVQIST